MNAEALYQEMKRALDYFGLRFNEKHEMHVEFDAGLIVFSHGNKELTVRCEDEHDE